MNRLSQRTAAHELMLLLTALSGSWPLVELVRHGAALAPCLVAGGFVWAVGAGMRLGRRGPALIVTAQAVAVIVCGLVALALQGTSLAPDAIRSSVQAANKAANVSVAPLPDLPGVVAMCALGAALVALVIDYVGGTSRTPLMAALPMAAPFVLVTTALAHTLPSRYFVAAALSWAALCLVASTRATFPARRWRSVCLAFAVMTTAALVAALALAPHVSHRATPALARGGARGVDTSVDFSESLDLSKSLRSRNSAPVLQYTTSAATPEPLRATTSSTYRDGTWQPEKDPETSRAKANTTLPALGVDADVPAATDSTRFTLNGMKAPFVATPSPLKAAIFGASGQDFRIGTKTGVPFVTPAPRAYSVLSTRFLPTARPTSDRRVGAGGSVTRADLDTDAMPSAASERVQRLIAQAGTSRDARPFDAAVAVQRYLRTDASFSYSLQLAAPKKINGTTLDPLSSFLDTRRGYCTQYATAMVMAARELGIPARAAIGFLPGTQKGGAYEVRAADAHAWAELYFPGMGWTRFDPTPGQRSGPAPAYAPDTTTPTSSSSSAASPTSTASPRTSTSTAVTTPPPPTRSASTTPPSHTASHGNVRTILTMLGALLVLCGLTAVLPLAGRRLRERPLQDARNDAERDEAHWHAMTWRLRDLGHAVVTGRSPRETADRFVEQNPSAGPELQEAVARAAATMEASRYAPARPRSVESACTRAVHAATDEASWIRRGRATVLPRSGVAWFRALRGR